MGNSTWIMKGIWDALRNLWNYLSRTNPCGQLQVSTNPLVVMNNSGKCHSSPWWGGQIGYMKMV